MDVTYITGHDGTTPAPDLLAKQGRSLMVEYAR